MLSVEIPDPRPEIASSPTNGSRSSTPVRPTSPQIPRPSECFAIEPAVLNIDLQNMLRECRHMERCTYRKSVLYSGLSCLASLMVIALAVLVSVSAEIDSCPCRNWWAIASGLAVVLVEGSQRLYVGHRGVVYRKDAGKLRQLHATGMDLLHSDATPGTIRGFLLDARNFLVDMDMEIYKESYMSPKRK